MKPSSAVKVLDKGFVRLVEFMGGDEAVVSAARVCTGTGSKGEEKDRKLIEYLLSHQHLTPFEHSVFKFHVSCPLFVMRQWIRHRSSSFNEISARYTEVRDEFYVPSRWRGQSAGNKQASDAALALDDQACTRTLEKAYADAFAAYRKLRELGAAREMARFIMPVGSYTQFYWTISSRNLLHFIGLRADAAAQWEIQRYAEVLAGFFAQKMPWTWEAYLRRGWTGANPILDAAKAGLTKQSAAAKAAA
ncbi:MAG: FAD-dependent thymidylate synthase [Elusimicrobia bacterium]|nr:FAD-dependent thymidylate synthase [Elusimicrobiota bacterium]